MSAPSVCLKSLDVPPWRHWTISSKVFFDSFHDIWLFHSKVMLEMDSWHFLAAASWWRLLLLRQVQRWIHSRRCGDHVIVQGIDGLHFRILLNNLPRLRSLINVSMYLQTTFFNQSLEGTGRSFGNRKFQKSCPWAQYKKNSIKNLNNIMKLKHSALERRIIEIMKGKHKLVPINEIIFIA